MFLSERQQIKVLQEQEKAKQNARELIQQKAAKLVKQREKQLKQQQKAKLASEKLANLKAANLEKKKELELAAKEKRQKRERDEHATVNETSKKKSKVNTSSSSSSSFFLLRRVMASPLDPLESTPRLVPPPYVHPVMTRLPATNESTVTCTDAASKATNESTVTCTDAASNEAKEENVLKTSSSSIEPTSIEPTQLYEREIILASDCGMWWPAFVPPLSEIPKGIVAKINDIETKVAVLWLGWGVARHYYSIVDVKNIKIWRDDENILETLHTCGKQPSSSSKNSKREEAFHEALEYKSKPREQRKTNIIPTTKSLTGLQHDIVLVRLNDDCPWWPALVLSKIVSSLRSQKATADKIPVLLLEYEFAWIKFDSSHVVQWPTDSSQMKTILSSGRTPLSESILLLHKKSFRTAELLLGTTKLLRHPGVTFQAATNFPHNASRFLYLHDLQSSKANGNIVMALNGGKKYWPGLIVDPRRVSRDLRMMWIQKPSQLLVYWYSSGSNQPKFSTVPIENIKKFVKPTSNKFQLNNNNNNKEDDDDDVNEDSIHYAFDDETPTEIALQRNMNVNKLLNLNRHITGLKANSKLHPGTLLYLFDKQYKQNKQEAVSSSSSPSSSSSSSSSSSITKSIQVEAITLSSSSSSSTAKKKPKTEDKKSVFTKYELAIASAVKDMKSKTKGLWLFRQHSAQVEHGTLAGRTVKIVENDGSLRIEHLAEIVDVKNDQYNGHLVTLRHTDTNTFETNVDLALLDFKFVSDKYRPPFVPDNQSSTSDNERNEWVSCEICGDWYEIQGSSMIWSNNSKSFRCLCFGFHCRTIQSPSSLPHSSSSCSSPQPSKSSLPPSPLIQSSAVALSTSASSSSPQPSKSSLPPSPLIQSSAVALSTSASSSLSTKSTSSLLSKRKFILPSGWTTQTSIRATGKTAGTRDKYYFSPSGKKFRSITKVMEFLGGSQTLSSSSSSSSSTSFSLPSLKETPKDPRNIQGIKNAMCQTCGATHPTFKEVLIPTNFICSMVNRECGFGRYSGDEVISFLENDVKAKTKQNEIVYSCNLFCGSGLSTWGFRCAGIHSALAFDAYSDCLDEHWKNHGDSEGDPPLVITTHTTLEQIESYLRDQPPLSCSHFVVKIGDNVSLKWYEKGGQKTLGSLTKRLISQIIIIKKHIITTFLSGESNVNVSFVGVATPPCYDISTANPHRSEEYGFSTMTSAFQLLDHCFKNDLLATYTIEMVSHARHSELVTWARTSARKYSLVWDYLLASDFNCPSNRERCFFKPKKAKWKTPKRVAPAVVDATVGSALGLKSSKFGLYGTTWGKLNNETTAMNERGFTITGNLPELCHVDEDGVKLQGTKAMARRITTDEQLALMGFPPSLRIIVTWNEQRRHKIAKWIGSGKFRSSF